MSHGFSSTQYCRFLSTGVQVSARSESRDSRESFEGGQDLRVLECMDKVDVCFAHSCYFTTDGGEWPFDIPLEELRDTFMHGGGI